MQEVIDRLENMLKWSDRIGSDEIYEIQDLITILKSNKSYNLKEMEKSFIAGGKLCMNITRSTMPTFVIVFINFFKQLIKYHELSEMS